MSDTKLNFIQVGDEIYNIGGSGSSAGGGYPVVTVENDFNIEAQPNTFYNIRNAEDSEVNISFKDEDFYTQDLSRHIFFTYDSAENSELIAVLSGFGGRVSVSNRPDFKYQMSISIDSTSVIFYFSDEIKTGNSVVCRAVVPTGEEIGEQLNNIIILNDNIDEIMYLELGGMYWAFTAQEVVNDNEAYNHKYQLIGSLSLLIGTDIIYSNDPLSQADTVYLQDGSEFSLSDIPIVIEHNSEIISQKVANEFVFSFNTPFAGALFDKPIMWNNNNIPDASKFGTLTISIVNGVACYTFV